MSVPVLEKKKTANVAFLASKLPLLHLFELLENSVLCDVCSPFPISFLCSCCSCSIWGLCPSSKSGAQNRDHCSPFAPGTLCLCLQSYSQLPIWTGLLWTICLQCILGQRISSNIHTT